MASAPTDDTEHPDVLDDGVADDAVVDPNFLALLAGGQHGLPDFYMPASMPRQVHGWRRFAAWTVISLLVTTVSAGICLTYGPEELWRVLSVIFKFE